MRLCVVGIFFIDYCECCFAVFRMVVRRFLSFPSIGWQYFLYVPYPALFAFDTLRLSLNESHKILASRLTAAKNDSKLDWIEFYDGKNLLKIIIEMMRNQRWLKSERGRGLWGKNIVHWRPRLHTVEIVCVAIRFDCLLSYFHERITYQPTWIHKINFTCVCVCASEYRHTITI